MRSALALLVALAVGCGARTSLPGPLAQGGGAGGEGGQGGQGGHGGVGAGGAGGAPPSLCQALEVLEPALQPAFAANTSARDPWLLAGPSDRVLALSRRVLLEGPFGVTDQVDLAGFDGWGAWPPDPGEALSLTPTASLPFAAHGGDAPSFALAVTLPGDACDVAGLYGLPAPLALPATSACPSAPLAAATAGDGSRLRAFDVPTQQAGNPSRRLRAEVLDPAGAVLAVASDACAGTPLVADVVARGDFFLLAHAVGAPWSGCLAGEDLPPASSGAAVAVRRLGPAVDEPVVAWTGTDDVVFVRLLPRTGGAWLILRESGASALIQPGAVALPLGPDGPVGAPFEVTSPASFGVAAAAYGEGFVTAHADVLDPSAPQIVVRLWGPTGALEAETSFSTSDAWLSGADRLSLVASTEARAILVAFVGGDPGPSPGGQLHVRRIDCVDPARGP